MEYKEVEYDNLNILADGIVKYQTINSHKDLLVWQRGMDLVQEIYIITKSMPEEEKFGLTSQIRRAAVSIPSNIAEGWGRKSSGSYVNFLKISNGSCCETETQLLIIEKLDLIEKNKIEKAKNLLDECGRMLRSLILKLEEKNKSNGK
jgi:four helix bundle protein